MKTRIKGIVATVIYILFIIVVAILILSFRLWFDKTYINWLLN